MEGTGTLAVEPRRSGGEGTLAVGLRRSGWLVLCFEGKIDSNG